MIGRRRPASPQVQVLESHQVHLWFAFLPQHDNVLGPLQMRLLTTPERQQHDRLVFAKDRHRYMITRALVRTVLSRYAPVEPSDWTFGSGVFGRPYIQNGHPLAQRLRFNISHTDSLIVLAVTTGRDIGVDVESTTRVAPLEVADRFFSSREVAGLRALPQRARPYRFWELWTLKESYIKARGLGLSMPLDKFSFGFEESTDVKIAFEEGIDDSPARWRFWQLRPDTHHLVAVCLEQTSCEHVEVSCRRVRPLDAERPLNASLALGGAASAGCSRSRNP